MEDTINNILRDKQDIKNQLGDFQNVLPVIKRFSTTIDIKQYIHVIEENQLNDSMIWGHSSNGVWGQSKWGDRRTSNGEFTVLPRNNTFIEYFAFDRFIDMTNSTGTLDTANEKYTLDSGEELVSNIVTKLRRPIYNVTFIEHPDLRDTGTGMVLGELQLGTTTFGDDNVQLYMSNDSGTNWYAVDEGEKFTFPTSSDNDELKYKIKGEVEITHPIYIKVNS